MSKKVMDLLNGARARELTAISQYMAQHYELEDQDFGKLASKLKEIAIQEMKHAERLIARLLFLEGKPIVSKLNKISICATVEEQLKNDLAAELGADQRRDVSFTLPDPGHGAVGFEIDACLRDSAGAMRCSSETTRSRGSSTLWRRPDDPGSDADDRERRRARLARDRPHRHAQGLRRTGTDGAGDAQA